MEGESKKNNLLLFPYIKNNLFFHFNCIYNYLQLFILNNMQIKLFIFTI